MVAVATGGLLMGPVAGDCPGELGGTELPPSSSGKVWSGSGVVTLGVLAIGLGVGLGISWGFSLVIVPVLLGDLVGLGVGFKLMLGSKTGAAGCGDGVAVCALLVFGD